MKLTPPIGGVGDDNFQSDNLFGFDEDQNITLLAPQVVDIGRRRRCRPAPRSRATTSSSIRHRCDG